MNHKHKLFKGDSFTDDRGILSFINDFNLKPIVRFYEIAPKNSTIVRAWQAHKKESKWFYCTQGSFEINLIQLDSFENPSNNLEIFNYVMNSELPEVLYVPGGYANGFKSLTSNSKLLVFSDLVLQDSKNDDYRFDCSKWKNNW